MSSSLMDTLMDGFRSQGLGEIATRLGQPEAAVSRGFESTIATMLGALGSKTGDSGTMKQIFDLASSVPHDEGTLSNLAGLLGGAGATGTLASLGSGLLPLLFGSQQTKAADVIGQSTGMASSVISSLLKVAGPMLLVFLSRRIRQDNLTPSSFAGLIGRESAAAKTLMPAGVTNLFSDRLVAPVAPVAMAAVPEHSSGNRWLLPVLAGLVLLAGLWWLLGRNRTHEVAETTRSVAEEAGTRARAAGDMVQETLTSGVQLSYPKGSLEDRLVGYLKVSSGSAATEWFEFDRLLFDTNSPALQASSQDQLQNVAQILKAYPKLKVKIGGYTDNTGDAAANRKLSQGRADSVMQGLIALGISPDRLRAEGYGPDHPVADNTTETGRQQNRRVALRVTES